MREWSILFPDKEKDPKDDLEGEIISHDLPPLTENPFGKKNPGTDTPPHHVPEVPPASDRPTYQEPPQD
ncbi:MAG: hypothetical protein WCO52_03685 [bacterium]